MSEILVGAWVSQQGDNSNVRKRPHLPADEVATARELVSRIQLCDVLLIEISAIRTGLANDIKQARGPHCLAGHPF
jgi:hypothetical protein